MNWHKFAKLFLFTLIFMGTNTNLYAVVDDFQLPMTGYEAGSFNGRVLGASGNHLGEDHQAVHHDPVYAVANGMIVYAGAAGGYGTVIVIEHILLDGTKYCSVYGHLCSHTGYQLLVSTGDDVQKGQLIAYIGDWGEIGGEFGPHLHLGLRRAAHPGSWVYYGYAGNGENYDYSDAQHRKPGYGKFTSASAFINGIVLSDGINVSGEGTVTDQTPLEVNFEIQNLTSHSIYLQDLTVAIHGTEDGNGRWINELKHTGSLTLAPYGQSGDNYVYSHDSGQADYEVVTVPIGEYYVRAKYRMNNEWIDIPIHFKNPPNMDTTTENSIPLNVVRGSTSFLDVPSDYWAVEFISGMKERGIMNGLNGYFYPDNSISRGESCTMIVRARGLRWEDYPHSNPFSDISGSTHCNNIIICYHAGFVSGYGDGTFRPNNAVLRREISKMVCRGFEISTYQNMDEVWSDYAVNDDNFEYAYTLKMKGVLGGYPDGRFGPDNNLTRAEAAKIFSNVLALE